MPKMGPDRDAKHTQDRDAPPGWEERDDEQHVFERRGEWFRQIHTDPQGRLNTGGRSEAVNHAARLGLARLRELDPGGPAPKRGFELVGVEKIKAQLRKADNPRPRSSFGFAARPVQVRAAGDLRGTTLKIALDKELSHSVDPATVRIFRFEESSREWHIVARSAASLNGDYAWAKLRRAGLYVPIGLPRDPWLMHTILVIHAYTPWLHAAREMKALDRLLEPICKMILCGSVFENVRGNPSVASQLGLPSSLGGIGPGTGIGPSNVCDLCFGLDLPRGGLPEIGLLEDQGTSTDIPATIGRPFYNKKWVPAGPLNFAGRIKCLAIHPANHYIVYAGGADGGVWKTSDGGDTWYSTMQNELSMAIGALGISASDPNVLYAATGENTTDNPSYDGVGVYKTTDGGGDWDLMAPILSVRCSRVLVHPTDPDTVYVAGWAGLHKSIDGGASWTNIRTDFVCDALMDPSSPDTIYAAVWNSGVWKTTTGGTIWSLLSNGIPTGAGAGWIKLAMGLNGVDGTAFLVAKMGTDSLQMCISKNAGATWTPIAGALSQNSAGDTWRNLVAVDPNNQDVIFAGGYFTERSSDEGMSFSVITGTDPDQETNVHADQQALVFSPTDSNICYLATDGGVYKSTNNGEAWVPKNQGLVCTQLYSIGVAQTLPFVMGSATQDQGIIRSAGSPDWIKINVGNEGGFFVVDPNDSHNVYTSPWNHVLCRSTDGGVQFKEIRNGLGNLGVGCLAVKPGDSNLLLCTGSSQLFRSTVQGDQWDPVLNPNGGARSIAFSPSSPDICYVGTAGTGRMYRSSGSGALGTWKQPYATIHKPHATTHKPPDGTISTIAVGWNDPNLVYIGYWLDGLARVCRSTDGGAHWDNASGVLPSDALPDTPVSSLVIDQYNPEVVYAATDIGVFRTRDSGDSWERFNEGMPRIVATELALQRNTNTLYVSTMGRGAYKRVL